MRWLYLLPMCLVLGCTIAPESAGPLSVPAPMKDEDAPIDPRTPLPDQATMEKLAASNPILLLRWSMERYRREVASYRATLTKQERVGGTVLPAEEVRVAFREKPFSVRMDWVKGARLARRTLYVEGENDNQLLVVGNSWRSLAGILVRDPNGPDAKSSARLTITEFGILIGSARTLTPWQMAKKRGDLDLRYVGIDTSPELGNRPCWKILRTGYPSPEDDGITESTFWFDRSTWLQVGSYLTGANGGLIGSYYFRDLELNPTFAEDTFTRAGLGK